MEQFNQVTAQIKGIVSNDLFIAFVLLASLYFCIRMLFPHIRLLPQVFRILKDQSADKENGISPFQAFMTALGGRVGVGNVAGVATAIATGGPGAIFWIWIFGIFGSCIGLVEAVLGQAYKVKDGDEYLGGPAYYIMRGIKNKIIARPIAVIYAVLMMVGGGFCMSGIQSNTVVSSVVNGFHVDKTITVIVTSIIIALIIWGGIKRIGAVEAILTPAKCLLYIAFGLIVIVSNIQYVGMAFQAIFASAFGALPLFGGMVGNAVAMGIRRGVLSTDVGYGPGAIFAASARCKHPVEQGLLQSLSVMVSTLIICTITALILLLTLSFNVINPETGEVVYQSVTVQGLPAGAEWVQVGLDDVPLLHGWGPQALAGLIAVFAAGSIVGYYYVIESNLRFLTGKTNKTAVNIMKVCFIVALIASAILDSSIMWNVTDIAVALLTWINVVVALILGNKAIAMVKDYVKNHKAGKEQLFLPEKYGIDDSTGAWSK